MTKARRFVDTKRVGKGRGGGEENCDMQPFFFLLFLSPRFSHPVDILALAVRFVLEGC